RRLCETMRGSLSLQSREGFGSEFRADLPLPAHGQAAPLPVLQGRVVALTPASSGLHQMLEQWLPAWGLHYTRRDSDHSLHDLAAPMPIRGSPTCLQGLRPTLHAPALLVTAYGNFLPQDQALPLAPLLQLARRLLRSNLLQALRQFLQSEAP